MFARGACHNKTRIILCTGDQHQPQHDHLEFSLQGNSIIQSLFTKNGDLFCSSKSKFIESDPFLSFQNFRDQSIDGTGLPLLTEEHLRNLLSMKLGPALKLKAILASRMGVQCQKCGGNQTANIPAAASSPTPSVNGAEMRRMSGPNGRRSESPRGESFSASFRTKMEALSPIYNSEAPEGVITTVTMTATTAAGGGGRSTPNEKGDSAATGKDIPMLSAER